MASDTETKNAVLTTALGAPVGDNQNSLTAGVYGPMLLQDTHYLDKMAHFDRERIPERVVHAKGAGAHGYFEVTADVTKFTKAKFLNKVGKRTPVFLRFSQVSRERGSEDLFRDPRGFAIKHYTEEGIFDLVANNTPLFFIRDPLQFPDFIHSQKRDPQSNLTYYTAYWDFLSLVPESIHQVMFLFSDRGIPMTYRNMHGFGAHTFKWVNEAGEAFWVKFHYRTEAGIKNFTDDEAAKTVDPDWATKDLFEHIASGREAGWRAFVQIMPEAEGHKYKWNILDVTKIWPYEDYPLIEYGRLVLNRNPINYFQETEQVAFCPANLVPGIEPSPDKMLHGRMFSYTDTQRHRLGPNFMQIPINQPLNKVYNGQRDGYMRVDGNQGNRQNYEPNSYTGTSVYHHQPSSSIHKFKIDDWVGHFNYQHPNDDFEQPRLLWTKVLGPDERERLVKNMAGHMCFADIKVQARMCQLASTVHKDFGAMLKTKLEAKNKEVKEDDDRRASAKEKEDAELKIMRNRVITGMPASKKPNPEKRSDVGDDDVAKQELPDGVSPPQDLPKSKADIHATLHIGDMPCPQCPDKDEKEPSAAPAKKLVHSAGP